MSTARTAAGGGGIMLWIKSDDRAYDLARLIAGSGFIVAIFGGIAILNVDRIVQHEIRPYVSTDQDLTFEKATQRKKIETLIEDMIPSHPVSSVVPTSSVKPLPGREARQRRRDRVPMKRKRESVRINPLPSRMHNSADQSPAPAPAPAPALSASTIAVVKLLSDQIAELNIAQRDSNSRVAVAESKMKQLEKDKTWYDWLALGVTMMGIVQGILGSAIIVLKWRRKNELLAVREARATAGT